LTAVWIVLGFVVLGITAWAVFDAFERTAFGCLWLYLFIQFPVVAVLVYLAIRYATDRAYGQEKLVTPDFDQPTISRFPTEIEKARFIEASSKYGTMYEPEDQVWQPQGFRHFTVERAEMLIREKRFDEAADYLHGLYGTAKAEHDHRALDTYRYYIAKLPGGMAGLLAREAEEKAGRSADSREPQIIDPPSPGGKRKRDVPF